MTTEERSEEALARARGSRATSNILAVIAGFEAKGIPLDDIRPRENCLTFWAWRALGRTVKKGEHGVKITTWIPMELSKREQAEVAQAEAQGRTKPKRSHCKPRTATVFHVSQTKPIDEQND